MIRFLSRKGDALKYFLLFILYLIVLVIVSTRIPESHSDSIRYAEYFEIIGRLGLAGNSDILFKYLTYYSTIITDSVEVYFCILFLLLTYFHYILIRKVWLKLDLSLSNVFLVYFIMLLTSTWFYVSVVNGIRQGLSLPLVYLSFFYFSNNKFFKSLCFIAIAAGFHASAVLHLPFLLLIRFNIKKVFVVFFFLSIGYIFGLNELVVERVSAQLSLPLYVLIKEYSDTGIQLWYGFYAPFFIYTTIYSMIFAFFYKFIKVEYQATYIILLKMFIIFSCYYYIFGFAAFSNRYAFTAWNLIPLLQAFILMTADINKKFKGVVVIMGMPISLFLFGRYFLGL